MVYFVSNNKQEIKDANVRTEYDRKRELIDRNLSLLDTTWKNIRTAEENGKLIVKFPQSNEISNGQRDILTFIVELLKFKSSIVNGKKFLLIIDEVFDYLDDANTITAQCFLSKFLDVNKGNMYLCILTHLNPFSFKNYIFSDNKVNHVYLNNAIPVATQAIKAFISFREGLDRKNDPSQKCLYDKLSHDLFHYNPIQVDYSAEISAYKRNPNLRQTLGRTNILHQVLIDEVNKYLSGQHQYDPYGVAMALRLRVEKLVYEMIPDPMQKQTFINEKMTKNKFAFVEGLSINIPDVLNIINAIHNEADHLKYNQVTHTYEEKAMVYKLQNNAIIGIIKELFGWEGNQLTTTVID